MASTYTTNLGIEKIGTGEQSGTWGETTNLNFDILDQAINGLVSVTLPAVGSTGSPNTLPITDGALSDGRNAFIELVDGGDLGGTAYVQLTPNDAEKIAYVRNSLSGGQSVILFQGTYNASNDFELANGKDALLYFNGGGTGAVVAVVQANEVRSGSFQIDNIVLDGNSIDVDGDLTIDVSDSDVLLKDDGTTFGGFSLGGTDTDNLVIKSGSTPTAALTLHEGNVGFGTQDEASYLIDAQSASAGIQARFISTEAGATSGPDLKFYRNSASPADSDIISTFYFNANTDDGAGGVSLSDVNYGSIVFNAVETNETLGEAAGFALNLKRGGTTQQYISIVGGTTGDTDNDSITLSTGGTAAITIDNSQNVTFDTDTLYVDATNNRVGVGTDSPSNRLAVTDSSLSVNSGVLVQAVTTDATNKFAQIKSPHYTNSEAPVTLVFASNTNTENSIRIGGSYSQENAATQIVFHTASDNTTKSGTERMKIDSSGDISFRDTSDNEAFYWDATNARLGIGTGSSPSQKLHVYEVATNSQAYLTLQNNRSRNAAVFTQTTNGGFYTGTSIGTDTLCWQVYDSANGERMHIDASGRVGIGCTPATALDVSGVGGISAEGSDSFTVNKVVEAGQASMYGDANNTHFSHNVYYDSGWKSSSNAVHGQLIFDSSGNFKIRHEGASASGTAITWDDLVTVTSGGLVGIGETTNLAKLTVNSGATNIAAVFRSTDAGSAIGFADNTTTLDAGIYPFVNLGAIGNDFRISTNNTEKVRVYSDGSVKVGESTLDWPTSTIAQADGRMLIARDGNPALILANMASGTATSRGANLFLGARATDGQPNLAYAQISGIRASSTSANSSTNLVFYTLDSSGTQVEGARFNTSGNLAFPNGQGIDFTASTGGGETSSLLDDYEEGDWTPTINVGTADFTYPKYVKIGRQVTVWTLVDTFSDRSTSSAIQIGGLPYASNALNLASNAIMHRYINSGGDTVSAYIPQSSSAIYLYSSNQGADYTQVLHSHLNNVSSNAFIVITYWV